MKQPFRRPATAAEFVAAANNPPQSQIAEQAQPAAIPDESPPEAAEQAPWANANPKLKVIFGVRLPEALHMKLTWLAANTVNNSMHSIALGAVEKEVERLLAEHYKN
jgi:hypothetical protein